MSTPTPPPVRRRRPKRPAGEEHEAYVRRSLPKAVAETLSRNAARAGVTDSIYLERLIANDPANEGAHDVTDTPA